MPTRRRPKALFAFTAATPAVAVGNVVSARGTVSEFFGLTQIESSLPGDMTVTTSATVPAPIALTPAILDPAGPPDQLERFEGMRLSAASFTSVAPTDGFGEIAAVLTGVARPVREPGIPVDDPVPPDPTAVSRLLHPALRRQPGTHRHRQRRPRRLDGVDRDLERRHRRRHRTA